MIVKRSLIPLMMLFSFSFAYAANGSGSIGTVSARGDVRVDGYTVQGNATLFDGTAIETGSATATLRLNSGTEVTMATNSQAVVHGGSVVLLKGKSELNTSNSPFFLEADGLRVAPAGPSTHGVVSLGSAQTVDVASIRGELRIADDTGFALTHVASGMALQLRQASSAGQGADSTSITQLGMVSVENGQYYLTTIDAKYLLTGKDFKSFVGAKCEVVGTLNSAGTPSGISVIDVSFIGINGETGFLSTKKRKIWFATALAAGGAGAGIAIYEANKGSASR